MNSRERFLAALEGRPVDRVPVSFSANAVVNRLRGVSHSAAAAMDPAQRAQLFVTGHEELGSDVIHAGFNGIMSVRALGGDVTLSEKHSPSLDSPLIREPADIGEIRLEALHEDEDYLRTLSTAREIVRSASGRLALSVGSYGPFTLGGLVYGADRYMRALVRDKALVQEIMEFTLSLYLANITEFLDAGADVAFLAEPAASGDMVSRRIFETLAVPVMGRVCDAVHAAGKKVCLHICGDITDRLESAASCGADIISLDYKVPMALAREKLGPSFALGGNADPVQVMSLGAPDEVRRVFRKCLEEAGTQSYVIMPGCTLPAGTPVENIRAMTGCASLAG